MNTVRDVAAADLATKADFATAIADPKAAIQVKLATEPRRNPAPTEWHARYVAKKLSSVSLVWNFP